jgi:hypothetical protein
LITAREKEIENLKEYKMLSELNFNIDTDLISKVLKKNWFEE